LNNLFIPGKNIVLPKIKLKKKYKIKLVSKEIEVTVPSRLGSFVFDLRKVFGKVKKYPKTGVLGYSIDSNKTKIKLKVIENNKLIFKDKKIPEIIHCYKVLSKILGKLPGFYIEIYTHNLKNMGFGSCASKVLCFAVGVNELLGNPLTNYELRQIIGYNYVEESKEKKGYLVKGTNFSLTTSVCMYGGMLLLGPGFEIIKHTTIPSNYSVIYYYPSEKILLKTKNKKSAEEENTPVENLIKINERKNLKYRLKKIYNELIPAMKNKDFEKQSKIIWEINNTFFYWFEDMYGKKYVEHLIDMNARGALHIRFSSHGPTTFFFCKNSDIKKSTNYLVKNKLCIGKPIVCKSNVSLKIKLNSKNKEYTYSNKNS